MDYKDFGITVNTSKTTGEYYTTCPKCSDDRKKKKAKCLSVNLEKSVWLCQHCGYKGSLAVKKQVREYFRPVWTNNTSLSDKVVQWFKKRGISQSTLIETKVTEQSEYMPQIEAKANCICFNYFKCGMLVNTKFRDGAKNFKLVKDAELIVFNYDNAGETIIITEGEIDCLSFIEAGIKSVVSVPNGAVKSENQRLDYLDNCYEIFERATTVILATDNDEAGIYLREELIRRIGIDKCFKVDFEDCKDANEYLVKYGSIKLSEVVSEENIIPIPIEGIVSNAELSESVDLLFEKGLQKGDAAGIKEFDDLITFEKGYITVVTGIPNHGKSDWVDWMALNLTINRGWKWAVFSPENHPISLHISKLISKTVGTWFGKSNMNYAIKDQAKNFILDNFSFIRPDDEQYSLDKILDRAKQLVKRNGINGLIIDPYNRLEHQIPSGMSQTDYVGLQFDKIDVFKKRFNVHVFLVAHPVKINKDKNTGLFEIPNLYSISGSANFYNKADNGICVYRDFAKDITDVYVQKIKFSHWGKQGFATFKWNENNGRYYNFNSPPTSENFLSVKTEQAVLLPPEPVHTFKPNTEFDRKEVVNLNQDEKDYELDRPDDTPF